MITIKCDKCGVEANPLNRLLRKLEHGEESSEVYWKIPYNQSTLNNMDKFDDNPFELDEDSNTINTMPPVYGLYCKKCKEEYKRFSRKLVEMQQNTAKNVREQAWKFMEEKGD